MPSPQVTPVKLTSPPGLASEIESRPWWRTRLFWAKFLLVATGVWWGIAMQLLVYRGAGEPKSLLPNVDWYVGMMLVYAHRCWTSFDPTRATVNQRDVIPIAMCDFIATIGTTVGLVFAGSAIFGIIFSSVTVWTALFTWLILKRAQSAVKLFGICCVVVGLAIPALGENDSDDTASAQGHPSTVFIGIILTSVGTLFYALEYTLCERAYSVYEKPLDAKQLCFYTGAWGLFFSSIWIVGYTIPHWNQVVADPVRRQKGDLAEIAFLYFTHTINNGVHNAAWFIVCELEGGVSTGLLMGLKAAALFFGSAAFFCDSDHTEQCLSPPKVFATVIVLVGTAIYYWPDMSGNPAAKPSCHCHRPFCQRFIPTSFSSSRSPSRPKTSTTRPPRRRSREGFKPAQCLQDDPDGIDPGSPDGSGGWKGIGADPEGLDPADDDVEAAT